jgi:hypothetical protein
MRKMTWRLAWTLAPAAAVAFLSVAPVSAGPGVPARGPAARAVKASSGSRPTSILGAAWNVDNSPIKQANLRLRDVVSGKVAAVAKGNDAGQFAFANIEPGSYVVELLTDAGRIQTVGHVFTIAPGETVATFVRIGTKVPWGTAFFSNTASAAASSAASQGITAIMPLPKCVSPPGCGQ